MIDFAERARGMFLGLAIGDALGAPVEFLPSPSDVYIADMGEKIEHYYKNSRAPMGVWTDDTSMALCVADSLLEQGGYDSYDIMDKFYDWAYYKYRAHPQAPIDIGGQVLRALDQYEKEPEVSEDTPRTEAAGNGCIMRLAPIIIANVFADKKYPTLMDGYRKGTITAKPDTKSKTEICIEEKNIQPVLEMARLSCRETHNSYMAEAVTEMFAAMLYAAMMGLKKNNIFAGSFRWIFDDDLQESASLVYDKINVALTDKTGDSFRDLGGHCLDAFLIAVWGLANFETFKDGMLAVIRLGGDTDTNAAIYGQLAGAYYGYNEIPKEWVDGLYFKDEILKISEKLLAMPECPILRSRFSG